MSCREGIELHKKRLLLLSYAAIGLLASESLFLHRMAEGLAEEQGCKKKHAAKQMDRLLSNKGISVWDLAEPWVHKVIPKSLGDHIESKIQSIIRVYSKILMDYTMQIDSISHEELRDFIYQLEQALYNHQQWYNLIIRTLTCRSPADKHDLNNNAHKECRFGQWYYENSSKKLAQHPGFIALGEAHHKMHQSATKLLVTIEHGSEVSTYNYDDFANNLEKMRLELTTLLRELTELLYNRDTLTGAINRINMLPFLREQQALVKRNAQLCSISMIDLDHFKKINDKYGHTAGDFVLAEVSHFFINNLRSFDKVFRIGGEEFLLCILNADTNLAYEMVERLRIGIESMLISINKNKSVKITVSFGITSIDADISIEQSIENADKALYKAKNEGKNRTCIYKPKFSS